MCRFVLRVLPALGIVLCGCATSPPEVAVQTSPVFSHESHLAFFASGRHRQEKISMHLERFGATEAPEELAQGRCAECHDNLADMACGSCHVVFQKAGMRAQRESRPCVGCHRGSWTGTAATLPRPEACVACHDGSGADESKRGALRARFDVAAREYAGGARVSGLPPNVYFSHRAHVQFASMPCARCHVRPQQAGTLPTVPAFTMNQCLQCHVESGARTDCLTCHK